MITQGLFAIKEAEKLPLSLLGVAMVPYGFLLPPMAPYSLLWSPMPLYGPLWSTMAPMAAYGSLCLYAPLWPWASVDPINSSTKATPPVSLMARFGLLWFPMAPYDLLWPPMVP